MTGDFYGDTPDQQVTHYDEAAGQDTTLREQAIEILADRYGDKVTTWGSVITGKETTIDINAGTVDMLLALFRDAMLSDRAVEAALAESPRWNDPTNRYRMTTLAAWDAVTGETR